jgi:acyl carrier protein
MQLTEQKLRKFVGDNFLFGQSGDDLPATESFIESGIIDSTGILELVSFVEQEFGVKIEDEELIPENLDSIHKLMVFVDGKSSRSTMGCGLTDPAFAALEAPAI